MDSVSRPYPISLAAQQAVASDAAKASGIRPSFATMRGAVVALGLSLMVRAATFLRSCNY
jgi:hypothetical protein